MAGKSLEGIPALYESHFLRDVTYTASGLIVVATVFISFAGRLSPLVAAMERHLILAIMVLVLSYVVGLLLQEGFTALGLFRTEPDIPQPFKTRHVLMSEIAQRCGPAATRELERTIYLKHVGAAIGSASVIASICLLVASCAHDVRYLFGLLFSLPLLLVCLYLNKSKLKEQNEALKDFASRLRNPKPNAG